MMTLFDIIEQAQNGAAKANLANQFGLSQAQAEKALEALMPAFSASLKQSTSNMDGLAAFMNALSSGSHARYYEDAMAAFTGGRDEGNAILGHMFGSKEVSRAVAAQAAQASGLGQDILKQMLPVIASMVMGGLFKQSTSGASSAGGSGNILADMMEQFMRGGTGAAAGARGGSGNPWADMLTDMMSGMLGGSSPQAASSKAEPPRGEDVFGPMFDAGREIQDGYSRGMDRLIAGYLKGMDRTR